MAAGESRLVSPVAEVFLDRLLELEPEFGRRSDGSLFRVHGIDAWMLVEMYNKYEDRTLREIGDQLWVELQANCGLAFQALRFVISEQSPPETWQPCAHVVMTASIAIARELLLLTPAWDLEQFQKLASQVLSYAVLFAVGDLGPAYDFPDAVSGLEESLENFHEEGQRLLGRYQPNTGEWRRTAGYMYVSTLQDALRGYTGFPREALGYPQDRHVLRPRGSSSSGFSSSCDTACHLSWGIDRAVRILNTGLSPFDVLDEHRPWNQKKTDAAQLKILRRYFPKPCWDGKSALTVLRERDPITMLWALGRIV